MVHEPEKSDSVVVAMKPANKAERSVAELVEPRTETKGLGREERTNRTSNARAGLRTGKVCHRRWNAYGSPPGEGRRRSSLRSCTISIPRCCGHRFTR